MGKVHRGVSSWRRAGVGRRRKGEGSAQEAPTLLTPSCAPEARGGEGGPAQAVPRAARSQEGRLVEEGTRCRRRREGQGLSTKRKHSIFNFNDSIKRCRRPKGPNWRRSFLRASGPA